MKPSLTGLFVLLTLLTAGAQADAPTLPREALCIDGLETPLDVEVADTRERRQHGLMGRTELDDRAGMLFLYDRPPPPGVGMYMYRTLIPLDVAFLGEAKEGTRRILAIRTMTPCDSDDPRRCPIYRPDQPFHAALEVNAGFFEQHDIQPGTTLHRDCPTTP